MIENLENLEETTQLVVMRDGPHLKIGIQQNPNAVNKSYSDV